MFSVMPFGFLFIFVFVFGSLLSLSSLHWLGIWAGLEINLMGFIPILVYRGITQETESGMKYFIIQALGSGMLMLGSLISFSTSLSWEMFILFNNSFGLVILVFGLMLKLGSFPFHFWLPSVMAGISWASCLILTTWQKVAPMFLLSSMFHSWSLSNMWSAKLLVVMAGLSSIVGGVGGLNQTQIRALLAYSSIGHMGWMLFCSVIGEGALKTYFLIYFFTSVCVFLVLWYFEGSLYSQMGSLGQSYSKINEVCLILMLLSLGGMPPFLGFVGKWLVVWSSCNGTFPVSILPLLGGSLISLFYYLSLFFSLMFFSGHGLTKISYIDSLGQNGEKIFNVDVSVLYGSHKMTIVNLIFVLNLMGGFMVSLSLLLWDFI
uniref:NADH-ubiquinone oxidoreductase chain 2 n=1 Tax=Astralium haematragum TaxID=307057 RepID=A0A1I9SST4_9VEST|nr:NADH dehydrogenase subunit 2 [Astralium haematragum]AOZ71804.1 NADH dehydrogenase subunit 2 [Astralium haematragum]